MCVCMRASLATSYHHVDRPQSKRPTHPDPSSIEIATFGRFDMPVCARYGRAAAGWAFTPTAQHTTASSSLAPIQVPTTTNEAEAVR